MKLSRLVEFLRHDFTGLEDTPILFAVIKRGADDSQNEVMSTRPISNVRVITDEVLLIMDPKHPPLSVADLESKLSELVDKYGDCAVEASEPEIPLADGGEAHWDWPILGTACFREDRLCLLCYAE
jgi:hypothetical protein